MRSFIYIHIHESRPYPCWCLWVVDLTILYAIEAKCEGASTLNPELSNILSYWSFNTDLKAWGWFVEQKPMLSSNFRCDQIHNGHCHGFSHTLSCYLRRAWVFNKPTSGHGINIEPLLICCGHAFTYGSSTLICMHAEVVSRHATSQGKKEIFRAL